MRCIPTMASLADGLVAEVVRMSKIRKYEKDEVIILEGSSDPWIYFLVHGELEVNHQGVVLHT
jgi:CRP-like cAMP-binding protein